jgi:hypothetical protein
MGQQINVRLQPDELAAIDAYRREQPDIPSRPEAIRRMIAQPSGLPAEKIAAPVALSINPTEKPREWVELLTDFYSADHDRIQGFGDESDKDITPLIAAQYDIDVSRNESYLDDNLAAIFLKVSRQIEQFDREAKDGDSAAIEIIDRFRRFLGDNITSALNAVAQERLENERIRCEKARKREENKEKKAARANAGSASLLPE